MNYNILDMTGYMRKIKTHKLTLKSNSAQII